MGYTSFVEERVVIGKYNQLQEALNFARRSNTDVYLLSLKKEVSMKVPYQRKISSIIDMGGSIDIIVVGNLPTSVAVGESIYKATSQHVGIYRYEPPQDATEAHARAEIARDIAEETNQPIHIYDHRNGPLNRVLAHFLTGNRE